MRNKVIKEKSTCFNYDHKLTFLKQHKKVNIELSKSFISYKTCLLNV